MNAREGDVALDDVVCYDQTHMPFFIRSLGFAEYGTYSRMGLVVDVKSPNSAHYSDIMPNFLKRRAWRADPLACLHLEGFLLFSMDS